MTTRFEQVGFSQRVQLDWMRYAADLVAAGNAPAEIEEALQDLLSDKLSVGGKAERGNREKAITILMKIWVRPRKEIQPLRDHGLELLRELSVPERLAVHWGLSMAVYPFWRAVAESTGRLLRLQGMVTALQVQRRMKEQLGQRETVARAARRVLRSFHDWGVLEAAGTKGVYVQGSPTCIFEASLVGWMMEAYLLSVKEGRASPKAIVENPSLFPFDFKNGAALMASLNRRLDVTRQGLDQDLVSLSR